MASQNKFLKNDFSQLKYIHIKIYVISCSARDGVQLRAVVNTVMIFQLQQDDQLSDC
jgi:hypothetical protein